VKARISRMIGAVGIILAISFVSLGFLRILPWETSGTLTATTIGLVSLILAAERKEASNKVTISEKPKLESEGELLWEESILVSKKSCSHYNLALDENEKVVGDIVSEDYFDMYFVTPRNFTKFNNDENFNYEYGTERASKVRVNFVPKKPGRFYCIIHNKGDNDIDVNVKLYRARIER
jgi:hypothetical protein